MEARFSLEAGGIFWEDSLVNLRTKGWTGFLFLR